MEPVEESGTATWEEARGPHLPDRLTALPIMIWPFIGLAILLVYVQLQRAVGMPIELPSVASMGLALTRLTSMTLLGAALFLRHPDAWSRLRPLAVGLTLIAVAEALDVLAPFVDDLFDGTWISSDVTELPVLTVSYAVGRVGTIAGLLGVASLWLGFRAVRTRPDPGGTQAILAVLVIGGLASMAFGYSRLIGAGLLDRETVVAVANWVAIAFEALTLVAWLAVGSVLLAGARVGEHPPAGWRVGAVAVLGIAIAIVPFYWFALTTDPMRDLIQALGWVAQVVRAGGAALLLAAFLIGLPESSTVEAPAA